MEGGTRKNPRPSLFLSKGEESTILVPASLPLSSSPSGPPLRAGAVRSSHRQRNHHAIGKGDTAPDFSALDQHNTKISLSDYAGNYAVALFFYPKDFTPGCTKEACAFRDAVDAFSRLGGVIIGVSANTVASHAKFDGKFQLGFPLLVDENHAIRKAFGVPKSLGLLPGRVTYVIDKKGIVRAMYNSMIHAAEHVNVARKTLQLIAIESKMGGIDSGAR